MTTNRTAKALMTAILLALPLAGLFCPSVLAANNPANIELIEVVDDGSGGYKPWEDVTGAMPGMTYSAIPRVMNAGTVPTEVQICLSESVTGPNGELIAPSSDVFELNISESWTLSDKDTATRHCYYYDWIIEPSEMTEPLFTEITLSSALGNQYRNSTFSLHLEALSRGDNFPIPDSSDSDNPSSPDTGTAFRSASLTTAGFVTLSFGVSLLIGMILYLFIHRRSK